MGGGVWREFKLKDAKRLRHKEMAEDGC